MRQRAKHIIFPALQFLQERRKTNRRRLKIRHWSLLTLRCVAVAALALFLARPSVGSSWFGDALLIGGIGLLMLCVAVLAAASAFLRRGLLLTGVLGTVAFGLLASLIGVVAGAARSQGDLPIGDEQAPVAALLVFDTAPRMEYRRQNSTRLEQARHIAEWLVGQFPADSRIAVSDASLAQPVFLSNRGGTDRALAGLRVTNAPTPLLEIIFSGLESLRRQVDVRQELYIFTDLAAAEWETDAAREIQNALPVDDSAVSVFVIDVGVETPHNSSLGELTLSAERLTPGSSLRLRTELAHLGPPGERGVELYLENPDAKQPLRVDGELMRPGARRANRKMFEVSADTSHPVEFQASFTELGTHHGWMKLIGSDGLAADDIRYFSIEIRKASSILIVAGPEANGRFLSEALAPRDFPSRFTCRTVTVDELNTLEDMNPFAAICLADPPSLPPATWRRLADYVERGHGLGLFLGRNAWPADRFNSADARRLLPAPLKPIVMRRPDGDVYLAPHHESHPLLSVFRSVGTAVPWHDFPVFRHWLVDEAELAGQTVIAFSNNRPALLERQVGRGRVLMLTTSVSDTVHRQEFWNRLPTGLDNWPFLILANESARYLEGKLEQRLNFMAGEPVVWSRNTPGEPDRYVLFTPDGSWHDQHATSDEFRIGLTNDPGIYRLVSADGASQGGFSANLAAASTDLRRTDQNHLDELFGSDRYTLVRTRDEIVRKQGEARSGKEFFPYLGLLLVVVLGVEQLLANRFYDRVES